ncbi:MAG: SDR family oxidoreductase [Planctomycetes bacterium]|nr:SDR family oxidoreductase [Planctomycetota bacterium]
MTPRVTVITGASRGVGAACARRLAADGHRVALLARSSCEPVAAEVRAAGGEALALVADVARPESVQAAFAAVRAAWGPVDVLVNNAARLEPGPFAALTPERWRALWEVNVSGALRCSQAALEDMRPRGRGVIVNVASVGGVSGIPKLPGLVGYATTKGALIAFSEALAAEVAPAGVRVVCVSPGSVSTAMLAEAAPEAEGMPPAALADVIAFLVSDAARAVHQANLVVWGPPGAR